MKRRVTRYANRKMYDPATRGYITLTGIAKAVGKGETVEVRDRETGEDITVPTLLLAMMELEKARRGTFTPESLSAAIRSATRRPRRGGGR
jgi:polyhydroxyalkanoate synthesis regulator protein